MTTTAEPNYWSLLGLEPGSDADELKRAFRREARRWHPDLNGNDREAEERFKLVNEAYAVLSDPKRRRQWEQRDTAPSGTSDPFATGFPDFEDYLDVVFGRSSNRRRRDQHAPEESGFELESVTRGWPDQDASTHKQSGSDWLHSFPTRRSSNPRKSVV